MSEKDEQLMAQFCNAWAEFTHLSSEQKQEKLNGFKFSSFEYLHSCYADHATPAAKQKHQYNPKHVYMHRLITVKANSKSEARALIKKEMKVGKLSNGTVVERIK